MAAILILALFAAAFVAFAISAVAGGGAGLVLVPVLRAVVPVANVPAALSVGTTASAFSRLLLLRRNVRWEIFRRFVPTALPAAAGGVWLLTIFSAVYVDLLLACFLLSNLPSLLRSRTRVYQPLSSGWLPAIGAVAGVLSGFTGAVGLAFNDLYRRLGLTPREIVATRAANEVPVHALKLVLYVWLKLLPEPAVVAGAIVAVAATAASIAARRLLPVIDERAFATIGRIAMVAAGAAMFAMSGSQLAELHKAWIEVAAIGPERELRLYLHGARVMSAEIGPKGDLTAERTITAGELPPDVRTRAITALRGSRIQLVEKTWSASGVRYEIYHSDGAREGKLELRSR